MNEKTLTRLLAVMVMVCCGNAVAQTTTNHTLIIKPNEHVSWSCELWPAQSAEVVFVPDSAPKGYVYEGMSIEKTQPNPGFCWTGAGDRYCILNSLAKSAVAMVTATCTWKPKGGEGGGSGGAPLPDLIGTGTATAIAQPGTYWSTAGGANVLALGMGTVVKALKDQGAPADSEWTCTTDQLMILPFGDLTCVTATGIVTSASAWDANVHSESLDYKGLSDDEPFTVVSVASISAKPAVVCVGNSNIAYTITTAPTGFEYMVRYTPADTSTPGIKEVIATCGTSAATCTVTVLKIEILEPSANYNHMYLSQVDYNETGPISFRSRLRPIEFNYTGNIDWDINLEYETDGSGRSFTNNVSITSGNDQAFNLNYTSKGGRLIIIASVDINGVTCSGTITNFITGVGIPNSRITQRLNALYTPSLSGTYGLLTGIAMQESTYRQFFNSFTKYNLSARWPIENLSSTPPQGTFIGMMQTPVAMDTAWNWLVNTQMGADIFVEKINIAGNQVANHQATKPELPNLTAVQLENYALGLYGGFSDRYYTPVYNGGQWNWQTTTRQDLLGYVSFIRTNIQ